MKHNDTFAPPRFTTVTRTTRQLNAHIAQQFSYCVGREYELKQAPEQAQVQTQQNVPTSSGQLLYDLEALQNYIYDCKRVTLVQYPVQNKFTSLQLDSLIPVNIAQKQEADYNSGESGQKAITSLDALNLDQLTPQERVAVLRRHPDLLKAFMEEYRQVRQRQRHYLIENDYYKRLKRWQQGAGTNLAPLGQIGPIKSFVDHNMKQSTPEAKALESKYQALQRDLRIYYVLAYKQFVDADFEQKAVVRYLQPRAAPLVAQTFVLQRNRLLPICFVAGRLALLQEACAAYAAVHASNVRIENASLTLQTEFRRYHARSAYLATKAAAYHLYAVGRVYICHYHVRTRREALSGIKKLLLSEYYNNTFLGAAARAITAARGVWDFFCFVDRRKIARKALIQLVLDRADLCETQKRLREEHFALYYYNIQKMLADPRQKRAAARMQQYTAADDPRFYPEITQDEIQRRCLRADSTIYAAIVELIYNQVVHLKKAALEAQWKQPEFVFFTVNYDFCCKCCVRAREIAESVQNGSLEGGDSADGGKPAENVDGVQGAWAGYEELEQFIIDQGSAVLSV